MKVTIGKYKNWIGPYQIADLFQKIGFSEDTCYKLGEWLATNKNGDESFLLKLCQKIDNLKTRKVKVKIHDYDIWSMDSTLAYIILPMLIKLKQDKHGSPNVDDKDVPESLKCEDNNDWGKHEAKWRYILDELIWTFTQLHPDNDWEEQYTTGTEIGRAHV